MLGHIFFIMGASGSGKGTLKKNFYKLNKKNYLVPLSYTTRHPRPGEEDKVHYNFISKEDFFRSVKQGEFLEYAFVHNMDYYGTKYDDVFKNGIEKGYNIIKELDINGLIELRKNKPQYDSKYTTIFLDIPIHILKKRIEIRGEPITNEALQNRLNSAEIENYKSKKICDYIIDSTNSEEQVLEDFLNILDNYK